ncbi:MAG: hypothetical protein IJN83_04600, partial [Clostridia bacterium]|nr:hypothetical protein [Clostridia bacterium]
TSIITDTHAPLTFEETKGAIKKAFEAIASYTKGRYPDYAITIEDIDLRSCPVQSEAGASTGYLVPAWVMDLTIGNGDYANNHSWLCVSTIDGSIISHAYMTEAGKRIAENYDNGLYYEQMGENEKESFRDAILRLYPLADEKATLQTAAEAFLTMYFDKMCDRDSGLDYAHDKYAAQNGQLLLTDDNYNDMMLLRQWIDHKDMLADFGYNIQRDCGRFASLDVHSIQPVQNGELLQNGDYVLKGYFKTTAFGTFVELGMMDTGGVFAITSVAFPDWKEYNNFCNDFIAFMKDKGYTDYGKSSYIDAKRKEREAFEAALQPTPAPTPTPAPATGEHAWRAGKLAIEPYKDKDTSLLELSHYGITLSGNGTEQTESMRESKVSNDVYSRDGQELLEVMRVPRGTLKLDVDLIQHSAENVQWSPDSETYGTVEYTPTWLPGHNDRVVRMTRRYERGTEDSIPYVTTIYSVQIQYNNSDVVLMFRFLNAKKIKGEWQLYQTDYDCEKWMRTFRINGAPNSIVDRAQALVGKPYKVGAYGPDAF